MTLLPRVSVLIEDFLLNQSDIFSQSNVSVSILLQFSKAYEPIEVTEFGIVTEVRLLQYSKADDPISVTEFGIVIEVRLLQP